MQRITRIPQQEQQKQQKQQRKIYINLELNAMFRYFCGLFLCYFGGLFSNRKQQQLDVRSEARATDRRIARKLPI